MSTNEALDPDAFRDFEHAGWEINVSEYEEAFARLTRQAISPLLDASGLRHGVRLLDVATGPGFVAAAAAERGARVVGIDFSASMIARARERNPTVEFHEGDGLKNRRLGQCKMWIRQVLISRTLTDCGEVAERLKAAVC